MGTIPVYKFCKWALWLLILQAASVTAVTITELPEELEVTISRGAHVTPIENVFMYTDMEMAVFTIPDLPDPPTVSAASCDLNDEEACSMFKGLQSGLSDITKLQAIINRILTSKGLMETAPQDIEIPDAWLNVVQGVSVRSSLPDPDIVNQAGEEWFTDTEAQLTLRKLQLNQTNSLLPREKRWIKHVLKAGVKLAKIAFDGDVTNVFQKLFVGDNAILSFLTKYRVTARKEFQIFANLPKRVSELETTTKALLLDVLNSTEYVKQITHEVQEEMNDHAYKMATVEKTVLLEQNTVGDIIRTLYTSTVYSVHLASYEECRSQQIPIAFVPPQLLRSRLLEIERNLPEHIRFVIPVEEFQRYYRLPLSQCVFDSNGGLLTLRVPLVEKSMDLHLFEFRAIHFAYEGQTCAIETISSYIVKEIKTNKIYSVTELDDEFCEPHKTGLCKVPKTAADDSNNFCISALLSGEPAHIIKELCGLHCYTDTRPALSQITEDVFIGVHLIPEETRMECPDETFQLVPMDFKEGSLRFQTVTDCKIFHKNQLIGKSSSKIYDPTRQPKIDMLMPVQMTKFNDLLPFTSDGVDKTVFSHAKEIYNTNFEPANARNFEEDTTETPYRISALTWNFLQSLMLAYLYYRVSAIAASVLSMGQNFQLVRASKSHDCELPFEAYALLWSILVVCTLSLVPGLISKVYNVIRKVYLEHVELVAHRVAIENA